MKVYFYGGAADGEELYLGQGSDLLWQAGVCYTHSPSWTRYFQRATFVPCDFPCRPPRYAAPLPSRPSETSAADGGG